MINGEQIQIIRQGSEAWNKWRGKNSDKSIDLIAADLSNVDLSHADLSSANLSNANLSGAVLIGTHLNDVDISGANLISASLSYASLSGAILSNADLRGADLRATHLRGVTLRSANLSGAVLSDVDLSNADLFGADLNGANLRHVDLSAANLFCADLSGANLSGARLFGANLRGTNLSGADLSAANLSDSNLEGASLIGCEIFAVSAWGLEIDNKTEQKDLVITSVGQPIITVDNIEVAQFIYLLLNNKRIRQVIDTITSKVVLILGRFTPARKAVLDAIREELRKRGYVPVLFDFDKPDSRDITETVTTLARLARFIIADITDPKSIPLELQSIVPDVAVPVQPLLLEGSPEFSMFRDLRRKYHWVLQVHTYKDPTDLFSSFDKKVIAPAEAKAIELRDDRT